MKVILLQNVKNLGKVGDVKEVSDGYARNFLFQRKLAEMATDSGIKNVEILKSKMAAAEQADLEKVQQLAESLQGREIVILAKEKDGKLFGSINAKTISKELKKENIDINEKMIILAEPIKEVGEYDVNIEFNHGIEALVKVVVEAL